MDAVTRVSASVPADLLDEVLNALRGIAPEVTGSFVERPGSDGHIGVAVTLVGDVRDVVREKLGSLDLEYQAEVGELG